MSARLTSDVLVKAMLRRAHVAGGSAMVLAKGDPYSGAILVQTLDRGARPTFYERGYGPDGRAALVRTGPTSGDSLDAADYWQRRRRNDPDLWVVELDVPEAQRFAAETIGDD